MIATAALGLLLLNVATFLGFALDKSRARAGGWRIPEARLLSLALVGGSPAALLARRVLRHKTRKQPFSLALSIIAMIQGGIALGLIVAFI